LEGFDFSARPAKRRLDDGAVVLDEWQLVPVVSEDSMTHNTQGCATQGGERASGRWGEQLAYRTLLEGGQYASVKWVNEIEEAGLPYDIEAVEEVSAGRDAGGSVRRITTYIEVKATSSLDRELFEVSPAELDFMRRAGSAFHIARIWGMGSPDCRLARLPHPAAQLASGNLTLYMSSGGAGSRGTTTAEHPSADGRKRQRLVSEQE
jgi:hypothetical protein